METPRVTRKVIQIISRHSNWPAEGIKLRMEKEGIYADRSGWAKFADVALLSLGVAFTVAGVIFFFAYNWHNLHKFVKLAMVLGLILGAIVVVLISKLQPVIKNVILTGASVLVGVLFAVFGQIYQTGADSYDFFLGWTVFVTLWAIVSDFAPLYLLWLVLVNTTIVLFNDQVGLSWPANTVFLILFAVNVAAILLSHLLYHQQIISRLPGYFNKLVALGAATCITISITTGIVSHYNRDLSMLWVALTAAFAVYGLAFTYSLRQRSLYFLCIMPVSIIIIINAWILNAFENDQSGTVFFLVSLFVVISITITVRALLTLNKNWHANE